MGDAETRRNFIDAIQGICADSGSLPACYALKTEQGNRRCNGVNVSALLDSAVSAVRTFCLDGHGNQREDK